MGISLITIGFAASLTCNVALWMAKNDAQAQARHYRALYDFLTDAYERLKRNSIRRDPKTGRYIKKGR